MVKYTKLQKCLTPIQFNHCTLFGEPLVFDSMMKPLQGKTL